MGFRNEEIEFDPEKFKPKSTLNLHNKDTTIGVYLMKIEIQSYKYNNLTSKEWQALYDLKDDKDIDIKGADKGSAVVVCDRKLPKGSRETTWG